MKIISWIISMIGFLPLFYAITPVTITWAIVLGILGRDLWDYNNHPNIENKR